MIEALLLRAWIKNTIKPDHGHNTHSKKFQNSGLVENPQAIGGMMILNFDKHQDVGAQKREKMVFNRDHVQSF